jgi:outer membrane protein OmpA-like peptidoglycan-associated protein
MPPRPASTTISPWPVRRTLRSPASRLAAALLGLLAFGCASTAGLSREEAIDQVDSVAALQTRLERANAEGLDVLAPRGTTEARDLLEKAVARSQAGDLEAAQKLADQGLERIERATADSQKTSEALRVVLASRERAVAAAAPDLLPERFQALEADLRRAARQVEAGDVASAKKAEPALVDAYSSLELDALKTDATDLARTAISEAREAEADEYAPETFARAKKELDIAEGILETDRSQVGRANVHARRAADFATQSRYVSELAQEFERRDFDHEQIVLWYQEQVEELMEPLEEEVAFTAPNHEVIAAARGRVASEVAARKDVEARLAVAEESITALAVASSASAEAQLEQAARYERVQAMFTENEAVVFRRGEDVLLETYGFSFPVGQSEILSENFALLQKISRAIAEFDNPEVVVSGHTDSTGSTELNQVLSEERAKKVGEFLVTVAGLEPDRVVTRGFGESRPVATNKTEAGRARNRRIEILIVNHPVGQPAPPLGAVASPPPPN